MTFKIYLRWFLIPFFAFIILVLSHNVIEKNENSGNLFPLHVLANEENIPVGDLIPGNLKRAPDYPTELEGKTLDEIKDLARGNGEIAQKAKRIKKLVE